VHNLNNFRDISNLTENQVSKNKQHSDFGAIRHQLESISDNLKSSFNLVVKQHTQLPHHLSLWQRFSLVRKVTIIRADCPEETRKQTMKNKNIVTSIVHCPSSSATDKRQVVCLCQ
jgi:hypothetical protein